jgi:NAD(P)-dependent dehydrogenase (short-subunit alcohol dehydrogenase family)
MKKIFILFGTSGNLGREALKFFLNKKYYDYYFFSRKQVDHSKGKLILVNDLTNEINVEKAFAQIERSEDNFYCLLNTVGGYSGGINISETPLIDFKRMIDINLTTNFLIAKNFIRLCKNSIGGSFIAIGALSGIYPGPNKAAYSISKNAINYLTKLLVLENKDANITFNTIAPYIIDSEENRKWVKENSLLIPKENICKLAEEIFNNHEVINGNVFELPQSKKSE